VGASVSNRPAGPRLLAVLTAAVLALGTASAASAATGRSVTRSTPPAVAASSTTCLLGPANSVKHVVYLQFDNVHLTRDNPNVPSDLEQMPNLLHFLTGNGTLITHEHTPLIAHTADDIVTSESGLYGSSHGMPIANEYRYYTPAGSTHTAGSFAYWRDPIVDYDTSTGAPVGDTTPSMVGANGKMAPAPWVPYTRSGCDFGSVAAANTELENTTPDVPLVFGASSPEAAEAENPKLQSKATADFMGLSVHCAKGSAICGAGHGGRPDVLPDEPGGYAGYQALFGSKFIQPVISPSGPVKNLDGQVIKDSSGDVGFPGYDGMIGPNALAYTLDMQTHGIPVTFTYLSDVHDSWTTGAGLGPGSATYEQQLQTENAAFGTFFTGLAAHGITKANTLFVITADEGDHFVGGAPSPSTCNGVTVTCSYSKVGEVDGNLTGLLAAKGVTVPFDVQADSAPIVYVHGQPARTQAQVRTLEQSAATLTGQDLATGKTVPLTNYLADPVELKLLHMITGDPKRTPTLALFGNTDFWLSGGPASCGSSCFSEPSGGDAWNHGTVAPEINTTWLGLAGPGVRPLGVDNAVWSDHTNIQPTIEGRVLAEIIDPSALPPSMRSSRRLLTLLGRAYTAINAPVGPFGLDTLKASTRALASNSPGDASYRSTEARLAALGSARDALASQINAELLGAAFGGRPVDPWQAASLIASAGRLLAQAAGLAH